MYHFLIFCVFTITAVLPFVPEPFQLGSLSIAIVGFIRFILFSKKVAKIHMKEEESHKLNNLSTCAYFDAEYTGDLLQRSSSSPSILFFKVLNTNQEISKFTFDETLIHRAKLHRKIRVYYGDAYIIAVLPIIEETIQTLDADG